MPMAAISKSERPKFQIPLQPMDYVLEVLAILGLIFLFGSSAFYYSELPEQIPTHFGPNGAPDGFGSKTTLWLLPVIGLLIYSFMTVINRRPEGFNYLVKITPENAERQYTLATRMVRRLKTFVVLLFAYLAWRTISIANGEADSLHWWLLPVVMGATLGTTFFYASLSGKKK